MASLSLRIGQGQGAPLTPQHFFEIPQAPTGWTAILSPPSPAPRIPFPPALQQVPESPDHSHAGPGTGCHEHGDCIMHVPEQFTLPL